MEKTDFHTINNNHPIYTVTIDGIVMGSYTSRKLAEKALEGLYPDRKIIEDTQVNKDICGLGNNYIDSLTHEVIGKICKIELNGPTIIQ